jgi:lipopolysaccharide/colanic/teichoic acid biosynthesis glycosyltransferase
MFAGADMHASRSAQDTPLDLPALEALEKTVQGWGRESPRPSGTLALVPAGGVAHQARVRTPRPRYASIKAVWDFAAALVLLVLTAPVVLAVMALVKLTSRGPALYSQVRLGQGGRPFRIWKIRTMTHDCERKSGARWATRSDPRVTPVGRVLRATHLDELPQLWNILRGDMSLIGPRPERPEFATRLEKVIPRYRERLRVRPGVTGLAQVQLPPDSDVDGVRRKVACDLAYIRHLSFWLDVRIVALTVLHVFGLPCHGLCRLLLRRLGRAPGASRGLAVGAAHR